MHCPNAQSSAHVTSVDVTLVGVIDQAPHILDSILSFSTRTTVVTCLRVNKLLHHAAGAYLYHTVRLDRALIGPFFLGAVKLHNQLSHCDWCNGEGGEALVCANAKSIKGKLLARVRVLSLGSHISNNCKEYGELARILLTRVRILRIVPTPATLYDLETFCADSHSRHGCDFLYHLKPKKIVLRNMDQQENMYNLIKWWTLRSRNEVVMVLPTDHGRFGASKLFVRHREMNDTEASYRFLFHDSWETWRNPTTCCTIGSCTKRWRSCHGPYNPIVPASKHRFISPDGVMRTLFDTRRGIVKHEMTIHGIESVTLTSLENGKPSGASPTQETLQLQVKDKAFALTVPPKKPNDPVKLAKTLVIFKTLDDYDAMDAYQRAYELDDGLERRFA